MLYTNRGNLDCLNWCKCEETPESSLMYCITAMLSMMCQDLEGGKILMSYKELGERVHSGAYTLPYGTTLDDLASLAGTNTTVVLPSNIASNTSLATRELDARHNFALVCYDNSGGTNRGIYDICTGSPYRYYCDSQGAMQHNSDLLGCDVWCTCEKTVQTASIYCITHLLSMMCQDMDGGWMKMSYKELEKGVLNGTYSLPSNTTLDDLRPVNTSNTSLATREADAKHHYALVCYNNNGQIDRSVFNVCAGSEYGYYCDANGNQQFKYWGNTDCLTWCQCKLAPATSLAYCITHMLSRMCQDLGYPNGGKVQMSNKELEEGAPNGTTSDDLGSIESMNTTVASNIASNTSLATREVEADPITIQYFGADQTSYDVYLTSEDGGIFPTPSFAVVQVCIISPAGWCGFWSSDETQGFQVGPAASGQSGACHTVGPPFVLSAGICYEPASGRTKKRSVDMVSAPDTITVDSAAAVVRYLIIYSDPPAGTGSDEVISWVLVPGTGQWQSLPAQDQPIHEVCIDNGGSCQFWTAAGPGPSIFGGQGGCLTLVPSVTLTGVACD